MVPERLASGVRSRLAFLFNLKGMGLSGPAPVVIEVEFASDPWFESICLFVSSRDYIQRSEAYPSNRQRRSVILDLTPGCFIVGRITVALTVILN
jgi:hypothetical protein